MGFVRYECVLLGDLFVFCSRSLDFYARIICYVIDFVSFDFDGVLKRYLYNI